MAEFIEFGTGPQTVAGFASLILAPSDNRNCANGNIIHRTGSGIITLRGNTRGCNPFARYLVLYFGNLAVPEGGTLAPLGVGLAVSGEIIDSTISMVPTPAAVEEFSNVSGGRYITVPKGCCYNLSLDNLYAEPVLAEHFNIIVTRTA